MSEMLLRCIENLKDITTEQGKQIATLTANVANVVKNTEDLSYNIRKDFKDVFEKLEEQNLRLRTVESWQGNFEKSDNRKIVIGCGLVGLLNIIVSVILVVGIR